MSLPSDRTHLPLTALTPDPRNARTHSEHNIALIADALQDVGAARSTVIDEDGVVLAGNATVEAAGRAGLAHVRVVEADGSEVIAVRRSGLSDAAKARLALYDNRTAELADWDPTVLGDLATTVDLSTLWSEEDLTDLLGADADVPPLLGDPDEIPDPPAAPVTMPGDLWQLGPHRLLCGDATQPEVLARLMDGTTASCLWTDPPYGVSYVGKTKDALMIAHDDAAGLEGLLRTAMTAMQPHLALGAAFYIAHPAGPLSHVFTSVVLDLGWSLRQSLVWVKDHFVLGHADYHYRHEPILFGYLPGAQARGRGRSGWYGDNAQDSIFDVPRPTASPEHPTSKPVDLIARMLANSTRTGDLVLDPFGGYGSTLVAAHALGRVARLLELNPRYCDVIVRRWEALTGETASRQRPS
jgi:site-specific DNA-methyltransferase (adenine-specific)